MVAVAPDYWGKGLGTFISIAALRHMRERGCEQAILDTDDFRLPAIRIYLALGFMPEMMEADHSERWQGVTAQLNAWT
jgi:mycothiol synthase